MSCQSGKVEYPTREAALNAQKKLVFDNRVRGRDDRSAGLNVYPCDLCTAWHIGHLPQTPSCYHYDLFATIDDLLAAEALIPSKPMRASKRAKRHYTGHLLASIIELEEIASMMWFTWDNSWDFSRAPHPGVFLNCLPAERRHEGMLRVVVPAFAAKLRWSDYIQRNRTSRRRRDYLAARGNPAQWLATDRPVPLSAFRALEVWYRDAWVSVDDVTEEDLKVWLQKVRKTAPGGV